MANHLSAHQAIQRGMVHTAVLAGGFGSRLDAATDPGRNRFAVAKPACTVGNLRIIEFTIRALRKAGISDFHLLLCFLPETIRQVVGNGKIYGGNVTITESTQDITDPLDTASVVGNLVNNSGWSENPGDVIIVPSADIIHDVDISAALDQHLFNRKQYGACATIVSNAVPWSSVDRFGTMRLEGMPERQDYKNDLEFEDAVGAWLTEHSASSAKILEFKEKARRGAALSNLNNSSIYFFDASLFELILPLLTKDEKGPPLVPEIFQPGGPSPFSDWGRHVFMWLTHEARRNQYPVFTYVMPDRSYWRDAGIGEELRLASMDVLTGKIDSGIKEGEGAFWFPIGDNSWRGHNVFVHPSAYVANSLIGDNVSIGPGATVEHSVIGSNAHLEAKVGLRRTVVFHQRDPQFSTLIGTGSQLTDSLVLGGKIIPGSRFNGAMLYDPVGGVATGSLGGKTQFSPAR
ncbi:MAG: sugar phosphate nucleotidyltransferase [Candidatus Margulisiibacteriota bacterium]